MINKTVLVTGGSSGVGKMIVNKLASEGNKVITLARRYERLKQLYSHFDNVHCYAADLSDLKNLGSVLGSILNEHGDIYYIINCAGTMQSGRVEELSVQDWERSIYVNAYAPIEIVKFFLPGMKKENFGRIINLTSGAPLNCFPEYSSYSVSKSVLNALTVTLAKELVGFDIKINLMSPGPVRSEMAPDAPMEPEVCLPTLKYLLNDANDSGGFFWLGYQIPLFPDLGDIDWLAGKGGNKVQKIL